MTMPTVTEATLRVSHVLGSWLDPAFHDRIHALEHRDAVDVVVVHQVDLARRRFLAKSRRGVELAIALPREERLFDGAILLLEEERAIIVRSEAERWLIELGYQAGNLHWRVRFDGDVLLVPLEGRPEDYAARLEDLISSGRVKMSTFLADAGASGPGSRHTHEHAGHHHHDSGDA